jgi:hypothetical protein
VKGAVGGGSATGDDPSSPGIPDSWVGLVVSGLAAGWMVSSGIYLLKISVRFFLLEAHGLADVLEGLDGAAAGAGRAIP